MFGEARVSSKLRNKSTPSFRLTITVVGDCPLTVAASVAAAEEELIYDSSPKAFEAINIPYVS